MFFIFHICFGGNKYFLGEKVEKGLKAFWCPIFSFFAPDILKSFSIKFSKISDTIANTLFKYTCKVCVVGNWNGVSSITRFHSCFLKIKSFQCTWDMYVFLLGTYTGVGAVFNRDLRRGEGYLKLLIVKTKEHNMRLEIRYSGIIYLRIPLHKISYKHF